MRETFISILTIVAVVLPARGSDVDGFNLYKDHLRTRSDEGLPDVPGERVLYFYRTPVQLYPGLLPALEQEYRKRTGNAFKNHMLNKELWQTAPGKRSSKTALALMLESKNPYNTANYLGDTVDVAVE